MLSVRMTQNDNEEVVRARPAIQRLRMAGSWRACSRMCDGEGRWGGGSHTPTRATEKGGQRDGEGWSEGQVWFVATASLLLPCSF